jgi:hypothetical protein
MAQVGSDACIQEWADDYLSYLAGEWAAVPEIAEEWDRWAKHERLNFILEWSIREDRWVQLQGWVRQGMLTPGECVRYEALWPR